MLRPGRIFLLAVPLLLGNCYAWRPGAAESRGFAALRSGDYARAREDFEGVLKAKPDEETQIGLLETLRLTGGYQEAAKRAETFLVARESSAGLHLEAGRLAATLGDYAAAEKHLRRSLALGGRSRLDAKRELADLLEELGRSPEAESLYDSLIDEYRKGTVRGSKDLGNAAVAAWKRGYIQDAKDIFLDATDEKRGEVALESLSDFGHLFLEKYNETDAVGVFRDCLKINKSYPPALVGIALAKQYENDAEVEKYALAALEVNPNLIPALDVVSELRIQEENYDAALQLIRRALAVNAQSLESLSLLAACDHIQGNTAGFADAEKKVLGINPSYGRLYYTLAENMVMRRKYRESVDFDRKAISLDPRLWQAYAGMGMNLTRIGDLEEGRKAIQQAFEGDPFNVWAYNTLELLDQMDKFVSSRSEHFVFRISAEDQPILAFWAPPLAEEVYGKLTKRYGFTPTGPLEFEIFPDHGGFAVRTLGLPGLGAVGVCFGKVVALDSPRAKEVGTFNWGSTLWHEFTHVITLQMTNYNIPRWYSEGLSVFEEQRARPGWGDHLTAAFVKAYKEGKLLKVSELNSGLMRPKFPEQVILSYYQASLFCELVEQKFGFDKIRQTLLLFAENKPSGEVFREALGWDAATMDKEYADFLDARVRAVASHLNFDRVVQGSNRYDADPKADRKALAGALAKDPDDFFANWQMGVALRNERSNEAAETCLKKAESVFPEFTEPGNSYEVLGELYTEQRREADALAQYLAWARNNGDAAVPLIRAAEIYRSRKDWTSAEKALELAVYINPYDSNCHTLLGEAAVESGNWLAAVRAYRVLVGLNPSDPAEAHYNLACALLGTGDRSEAKREVLKALEIAPSYEKAQQLLLQLSGGDQWN